MHSLRSVVFSLLFVLVIAVFNVNCSDVSICKRIDDIEKSIEDCRNYRALILQNGLTALLISDPDTEESAACLSVAVGSMSDPANLPGLSNLCEYMLFLGTKKYPEENEFLQFLSQNGGDNNAFNANDQSNYYFHVKTESLEPSLDRLAQFFINPLFTANATEREISAVNYDYEKSVGDDGLRIYQLERNAADPCHPFHQFDIGNTQTLWDIPNSEHICIRDKLLEFYSEWYSSNLMYLTILGTENLNTLEKMAVSLFGDIKRKYVEIPYWNEPIYKSEQLATITLAVPLNDISSLTVSFLISDQTKYYKSMPDSYLSELFGYGGPNSILAALKKRELSNKLSADSRFEARGVMLFDIKVDLTEKGVDHIDEIIKLIFQYVNMLRLEEPQKWFQDENSKIKAAQFQFKDKDPPSNYVTELSSKMIVYKLEDVLIAQNLILDWKPKLITQLLSYFRPDNMRVTVVSKTFQNETDSVEKYFGTQYSIKKIPAETLNEWKKDDLCEDLKMPSKNEFVATDFNLVSIDNNEPAHPYIIHESSLLRCWFKTDTEFRFPKAFVSIDFFSPLVKTDPFYCNIMSLFVILFNDDFSEYLYDATRAGLNLIVTSSSDGFKLELSGFNQNLHILLKETIDKLFSFKINPVRFESLKEEKIEDLSNIDMEQPFIRAMEYSSFILLEDAWTPNELLAAINDVKIENIKEFIEKFFSQMFMESLIYGNIDKPKALELIQILEKPFLCRDGFRRLLPRQMFRSRKVRLEDRESALFKMTSDQLSSSCVYIHLQCGVQSTIRNLIVDLFNDIIEVSFYNTLRTQEQLGYVVFSSSSRSHGILSLYIVVQSDRNPMYVDSRIENYISTIEQLLLNMSEDEFNQYKDSFAVKLLEKPKGLMDQAAVYQKEIDTQDYNFKRAQIAVEALKLICKDDIIKFYNDQISQCGPKRHKLAVHVRSTLKNTTAEEVDNIFIDKNINLIKDITEFKKTHQLYQLPSSNMPPIQCYNQNI